MYIYTKLLGVIESTAPGSAKTPELAKLQYFKEQEFLIKDRIRKSQENIKMNQKALKKLESNFSELIDLFPEEFI